VPVAADLFLKRKGIQLRSRELQCISPTLVLWLFFETTCNLEMGSTDGIPEKEGRCGFTEGQKGRCLLREMLGAAVLGIKAVCGSSSCHCHSSPHPQGEVLSQQGDTRCLLPYLHIKVHLVPCTQGKQHVQGFFRFLC